MTPSIRTELATAVRAVNAAFNRLPQSVQTSIVIAYSDLDAELDRALLSDDRGRALRAVQVWREHNLALIRRAGR